MISNQERNQKIRRELVSLRAQAYRQNIRLALNKLSAPLTVVRTGLEYFTSAQSVSFLSNRLVGSKRTLFTRLLWGAIVLAVMRCKKGKQT